MVGYENVLFRFVEWRFVNVFVVYPDEKKPDARPIPANAENNIPAGDLSQKQCKEYDRYHNDHQRHEYDEGIQTVHYPDWRQEKFHGTK